MAEDIQIANGAEWRKDREEGVPIRLPNGKWIRMRAVTFDLFVKLADIPDYMTPIVEEMLQKERIRKSEDVIDGIRKKGLLELIKQDREIGEAFCKVSWVQPRVVDDPKEENEISPNDLDHTTIQFVMSFFGAPIDEMRGFSAKQMEPVEPMDNLQNNADESKQVLQSEQLALPETGNPG